MVETYVLRRQRQRQSERPTPAALAVELAAAATSESLVIPSSRSTKTKSRVVWIDSLRFLSILLIFYSTCSKAVNVREVSSLTNLLFYWPLCMLFLLMGRSCALGLLVLNSNNDHDVVEMDHDQLSFTMLSRPLGLGLACLVTATLQYFLTTYTAIGIPSYYYSTFPNFGAVVNFVITVFTIDNTATASSNVLMYLTWFLWTSVFIYLLAFLTTRMGKVRYLLYIILFYFSWATYTFNMIGLAGFIIGDLGRRGGILWRCRMMTKNTVFNVMFVCVGLGAAFVVVGVQPVSSWIDGAFSKVQIYPLSTPAITGSYFLSSALVLSVVEGSKSMQFLLDFIGFEFMAKCNHGLFVWHPIIAFTLGSYLYSSAIITSFSLLYGVVVIASLFIGGAFYLFEGIVKGSFEKAWPLVIATN